MTMISSLPNELLVAIAVAGQEDNEVENWETQSTTWKAEWTLSHLSRRFRHVIVGAPELWALVEMDVSGKGSVEILELYLERSRAYKISMILRQSLLPHHWAYQIVPHLSRIQSLRISLRTEHALEMLMDPLRDIAAPRLQHLEVVYITEEHDHVGPGGVITIFSFGAPRLSFLKIDGFMLQLPDTLPLLTASLTHLELRTAQYRNPDINRIAAITAQWPFLTRLHLDITFESVAHNRFHIPTLKFLHISISEFEDSDFLPKILDSFDTPALTELIVGGTHGDQVSQLLSSTGLPHSSFPALLSLSFALACTDSCPCETDLDSLPFLTISSPPAVFPVLSHIALINQCFTSRLIRDILGSASEPWPLLETVTLCARRVNPFWTIFNTVEEAVKSRRERGQPLPKIKLFRAWSSRELRNWSSADGEIFW